MNDNEKPKHASPRCTISPQVRELFSEQLSDEQAAIIGDHVASCPVCATEFERLASEDEWLERHDDPESGVNDVTRQELISRLRHRGMLTAQPETMDSSSAPSRQLLLIPGYEEMQVVGEGGMGIVYKAFNSTLKRTEAVKTLAPHLVGNATARQRFIREARAVAAISDDHVVRVYSVGDSEGIPFMAMEFIDGESLQDVIDQHGPLSAVSLVRIALQVARGLAAAHAQGVVHRDIKPSNILLVKGCERAYITDFGLARVLDEAQVTRTGVISGTPEFMSPEQAKGGVPDEKSDLFSLGVLIYAMGAGYSPFRAETALGVIGRVTEHEPRWLTDVNPNIESWLSALVERLLAKSPGDRIQSAEEVARRLERFLAHLQQPANVPVPEAVPRLRRRHTASQRIANWIDAAEAAIVQASSLTWESRRSLYFCSVAAIQLVLVAWGTFTSSVHIEAWLLPAVLVTLPAFVFGSLVLGEGRLRMRILRSLTIWLLAIAVVWGTSSQEAFGTINIGYVPTLIALLLVARGFGVRIVGPRTPRSEGSPSKLSLRELFVLCAVSLALIGLVNAFIPLPPIRRSVFQVVVFALHMSFVLFTATSISLARITPFRSLFYVSVVLLVTVPVAVIGDEGEWDIVVPLLLMSGGMILFVYTMCLGFRLLGYRLDGIPSVLTGHGAEN